MGETELVRPETDKVSGNTGEKDRGVTGSDSASSGGKSRKRGRPRKNNTRDTADAGRISEAEGKSLEDNLERLEPEIVSITENFPEEVPKVKKIRKQRKSSITTKDNLHSVFSLVSSFAGSIWELSEEECEKLAEPLDSILSRYDFFEKFSKHGDVVSLCLTSLVIFTPRVLLSLELAKDAKRRNRESERQERKTEKLDTPITPIDTSTIPVDIKNYLSDIH